MQVQEVLAAPRVRDRGQHDFEVHAGEEPAAVLQVFPFEAQSLGAVLAVDELFLPAPVQGQPDLGILAQTAQCLDAVLDVLILEQLVALVVVPADADADLTLGLLLTAADLEIGIAGLQLVAVYLRQQCDLVLTLFGADALLLGELGDVLLQVALRSEAVHLVARQELAQALIELDLAALQVGLTHLVTQRLVLGPGELGGGDPQEGQPQPVEALGEALLERVLQAQTAVRILDEVLHGAVAAEVLDRVADLARQTVGEFDVAHLALGLHQVAHETLGGRRLEAQRDLAIELHRQLLLRPQAVDPQGKDHLAIVNQDDRALLPVTALQEALHQALQRVPAGRQDPGERAALQEDRRRARLDRQLAAEVTAKVLYLEALGIDTRRALPAPPRHQAALLRMQRRMAAPAERRLPADPLSALRTAEPALRPGLAADTAELGRTADRGTALRALVGE